MFFEGTQDSRPGSVGKRRSQCTNDKLQSPRQHPRDQCEDDEWHGATSWRFSGRPRTVFVQVQEDRYYACTDYAVNAPEQDAPHRRSSSSSAARHPDQQRRYVIYSEAGYLHRWSNLEARASSAETRRGLQSGAFDFPSRRLSERRDARVNDADLHRDDRFERSSSSTTFAATCRGWDESPLRGRQRLAHSRDTPERSAAPRGAAKDEAEKQQVQVPPKASDHPVALLLAALDKYHPGKLVEWLQRRTTRLEDAPMLPPQYDEDLYESIEVHPKATASEIRKAYRRLALLTHPDKPSGDRRRFEKVARAYTTLSDPLRREAYDAVRRNGPQPRPPRIVLRSGRDVASDVANDFKTAGDALGEACQHFWASLLCKTQQIPSEKSSVSKAFAHPMPKKQTNVARMISTAEEARRPESRKMSTGQQSRQKIQAKGSEFL